MDFLIRKSGMKNYPLPFDVKKKDYFSNNVISLTMYPYLSKEKIHYICNHFNKFINEIIL